MLIYVVFQSYLIISVFWIKIILQMVLRTPSLSQLLPWCLGRDQSRRRAASSFPSPGSVLLHAVNANHQGGDHILNIDARGVFGIFKNV